jgi:hypothetical protein
LVDLWKVVGGALGALGGVSEIDIGSEAAGGAGGFLATKGWADFGLGIAKMYEGIAEPEGWDLPGSVAEGFADLASLAAIGKTSETARLAANLLDIFATKGLIRTAKRGYLMKHPFAGGMAGEKKVWTPLGPMYRYDKSAEIDAVRIGQPSICGAIDTANAVYLTCISGDIHLN